MINFNDPSLCFDDEIRVYKLERARHMVSELELEKAFPQSLRRAFLLHKVPKIYLRKLLMIFF